VKKTLKTLTGLIFAALFLYLALKGQPLKEIFEIVLTANPIYIFFATTFYILSYVARSEKWRIQVENLGYTLVSKTAFFALVIHFFINNFTIKLGALVRCSNLKKTANIPFPVCLGTFISEGIFDFLFLFIGLFLVLGLKFQKVSKIFINLFTDLGITVASNNLLLIILITGMSLLFIIYSTKLYKKHRILNKYRTKIQEFTGSIKKTFNIKKLWIFIIWNIMLWALLYFMNYFLFISLFNEGATFLVIFTITTFSYAAWLMPNPGGIGSVEYFVLQAFLLFGLTKTSALAFGILSNGFTLITTLLLGFILIIVQSIFKTFVQEDKNILVTQKQV